ncbi:MAG: hypothetical protein JWN95_1918 [Frankiales bacterium]|nr:hypothetical protein [Frankiales bacterium]
MARTQNTYDIDSSHARTIRIPRTRGAVSGLLLVVLGIWGALIPFVGPYFHYSYQRDDTWIWTTARFWLEVLPGGAAALGGLLLLISANRIAGGLGGWLAALAGAWFVVGQTLSEVLRIGSVGSPTATTDGGRTIQQLGFFYGLGALILFLGSFALGRLSVVGVRDVRAARKRDQRAVADQQNQQQRVVRTGERRSDVGTRDGYDDDPVPVERPVEVLAHGPDDRPDDRPAERPAQDRPGI